MWTASTPFASPGDTLALEEGQVFSPKFNADGLISAIVVEDSSGEILMLAHMNDEALRLTLETKQAWYFSRSRNRLWRKGESSGHTQSIVEIRVDCDQDAVILRVVQTGSACHTNRKSCFYRKVEMQEDGPNLVEI
jgi:phosphoribosyl-AMP cyclohydrolase